MKTLLTNLQALLKADTAFIARVDKRNILIGEHSIQTLVPLKRFPFLIIDEDADTPEEFGPTDVGSRTPASLQPLRARIFRVTLKLAVRHRGRTDALVGDDGILILFDLLMDAIFNNTTVGGRVERLDETIMVRKAKIFNGTTFLGIGREISLIYYTIDEYT